MFQLSEALTDDHFITNRLFPVVLLHLRMNKPRNIALVAAQYFGRFLVGEIGQKMLDRLAGKVVEQVGMVIVGYVVEIDEDIYDIILAVLPQCRRGRAPALRVGWSGGAESTTPPKRADTSAC